MQLICRNPWCHQSFEITQDDLAFYEKVSPVFNGKKELIPPPLLCYNCRQQRRLAFRNERYLYKRMCDLCKRPIISIYSPEKPDTVYCPECWWGDKWDPLAYGRPFDPQQPFFEQLGALVAAVPKISTYRFKDDINSDYTHDGYRLKNCYLIFDGEQTQDSLYGEYYTHLKNCCDFFFVTDSELCYECIHCQQCFNVHHCAFCQNCSDSAFLLDCRGCRHCIGCTNLVQKEYHIFNDPVGKEEFEHQLSAMKLHTHSGTEQLKEHARQLWLRFPRKATRGVMNENARGDNLTECKDSFDCFDSIGLRNCRYCTGLKHKHSQDCEDVDAWGDRLVLAYNSAYCGAGSQNLIGCYYTAIGASDILSSSFCQTGVSKLIGCVGLKKQSHCILNKKYSKEEYERLGPAVIERMRRDSVFGEFFPPQLSAFGYNETVAQDYYPLSHDDVLARGWKWRDAAEEIPHAEIVIEAKNLPDSLDDIPDDVLNWAMRCEVSGKPYKLQKSELALYRRMRVPLPRRHFEVRHAARYALRNPRQLWNRECAKCQKPIATSYSPERPEIVYCENCYLKEVY